MIDRIVAPAVADESFADPPDDELAASLFPAEAATVAAAVAKRRNEFAAVRLCARRALGRLGIAPAPIVSGRRGVPCWPAGVVGSMTHCAGYRAAAVASADVIAGAGIDAEPDRPLPAGVLDAIARPEERSTLTPLADVAPAVHADRLLFSAKESVFKAWYPLAGRELDFDEASLTFEPAARTFSAQLLAGPAPVAGRATTVFRGRWVADRGLVITAVVLPVAEVGP